MQGEKPMVTDKGNGSTPGGNSVAAWPTEVDRTFSLGFHNRMLQNNSNFVYTPM